MGLTASDVVPLAMDVLIPKWQHERGKLNRVDRWARWDHDRPDSPKQATSEYRELVARSQAPWGDLIVGSVAQTLYVEGYRRPEAPQDSTGWRIWQANGMDSRQVQIHRATLAYGSAYGTCLPGRTLAGEVMPVMRGVSPRDMLAVYDDPAADEWPVHAIHVAVVRDGYRVQVFDDEALWEWRVRYLTDNPGDAKTRREHGAGVCPVVRYTNRLDLEGRTSGEIEPFIPLLGKIDQTSFDRLVVQRFASWVVRTITGMSVSETTKATGETAAAVKQRLSVEGILVAEDPDTQFGSLPATQLNGFIEAHDSDLRTLSAVSQTPAFELLGQMANLSAEALAAAKASQTAKSDERKHTLGEEHERLIRLGCHMAGDVDGASDFAAQVRWADTSIRSLAQASDALGKLAQMLGVPVEVLWPKIPGFTQQDVDEARGIAAQGGGIGDLLRELQAGQTTVEDPIGV
ncbi:MAG: phage portal protein [Microthrixaceae bacterium]